jgi:hypothetical protein
MGGGCAAVADADRAALDLETAYRGSDPKAKRYKAGGISRTVNALDDVISDAAFV